MFLFAFLFVDVDVDDDVVVVLGLDFFGLACVVFFGSASLDTIGFLFFRRLFDTGTLCHSSSVSILQKKTPEKKKKTYFYSSMNGSQVGAQKHCCVANRHHLHRFARVVVGSRVAPPTKCQQFRQSSFFGKVFSRHSYQSQHPCGLDGLSKLLIVAGARITMSLALAYSM